MAIGMRVGQRLRFAIQGSARLASPLGNCLIGSEVFEVECKRLEVWEAGPLGFTEPMVMATFAGTDGKEFRVTGKFATDAALINALQASIEREHYKSQHANARQHYLDMIDADLDRMAARGAAGKAPAPLSARTNSNSQKDDPVLGNMAKAFAAQPKAPASAVAKRDLLLLL